MNTAIARAFLKCCPKTALKIADLRNAVVIKKGFCCGKLHRPTLRPVVLLFDLKKNVGNVLLSHRKAAHGKKGSIKKKLFPL